MAVVTGKTGIMGTGGMRASGMAGHRGLREKQGH